MATRKQRTARRSPAPARIPRGFRTVTPYLTVEGGSAALDFYRRAFGARELRRELTPDGRLIHGRLRIGDSIVMLSDAFPGGHTASPASLGASTVTLHIYTEDVDRLWSHAVEAGAKVVMPLENQFWGERYGQLVDPFGHRWSLSQTIRLAKAEREALREQAMATFRPSAPDLPETAGPSA